MNKTPLICIFVLAIIGGFLVNSFFVLDNTDEFIVEKYEYGEITIDLLAVINGAEASGLLLPMTVSAQQGSGNLYVDIDDPTFIADTQHSARIALGEAERFTNKDFSDIDVLLSIETVPTLVSGPSAGAPMAVGIAAAVLNRKLNPFIAMSGTIRKGGTIGPVGSILEKAEAAKKAGKSLLLVPKGESVLKNPEQLCEEEYEDGLTTKNCIVNYEYVTVEDVVGIEIKEVEMIEEAFKEMVI